MIEIPPPQKMASLVSNVTETMLGISFEPVVPSAPAPHLVWRTVMLPIPGATPITVGLSSDEPGCKKLGSAMFQVPFTEVDVSMMNDSLCELVNMTAGLLKSTLALDQPLGLPRVVPQNDPHVQRAHHPDTHVTVLRAKEVGLMLWVLQGVAA
jgi:Chemotaxis phosphatase CheX